MQELEQPVGLPHPVPLLLVRHRPADRSPAHRRARAPDSTSRNVEMHGVGHMSLPIMQSVVHGISAALAHLDSDGGTVAPVRRR